MITAVQTKKKLSITTQAIATVIALISAVALPQAFHLMGRISGLGTSLGAAFLPMHLPIILVGLLAGPFAGGIAGALAPLVSYALTGMPMYASLPFMIVEVCFYGLIAGLLRTVKMPTLVKVVIAQIGGRAFRAVAVAIAVYGLGSNASSLAKLLASIPEGIFGLALQWLAIPLIIHYIENRKAQE